MRTAEERAQEEEAAKKASLLLFVAAIVGFVLVITSDPDKVEFGRVLGWVLMFLLPLFLIVWYHKTIKQCICPPREEQGAGFSVEPVGLREKRFQIEVL